MRPMLAASIKVEDLNSLHYPLLISPKIDGIRCLFIKGQAFSRSLKPIRNIYVQELAATMPEAVLDGELTAEYDAHISPFRDTSSCIMSKNGSSRFTYNVFDSFPYLTEPYGQREKALRLLIPVNKSTLVRVPQIITYNGEQALSLQEAYLTQGYEGIILRSPYAEYKMGRSTRKEQGLLKLKNFLDAEAQVIGFTEMMHNDNLALINELGYTHHSQAMSGKVKAHRLGALKVQELKTGIEFEIGSGFTMYERKIIWGAQNFYLNKIIKYKYMEASGGYDKPRHPVFLSFRDPDDLSQRVES